MPYLPLHDVRVLDLGILIPPALTTAKLVALGADVVKVEQPDGGDRIRAIPPFAGDGESPHHMSMGWGKRSIALDLRTDTGRATFHRLADVADVIVENQLPGAWARLGLDLTALRRRRPSLVICSITGFGQTGPLADLPSHGLNMDALADTLNVEWDDGLPRIGWTITSWGNELGSIYAALAIVAALLDARTTGEGAWIDLSCWDTLVEAHRVEVAMTRRTGVAYNRHDNKPGALYNTYLSSDGKPVMIGALERKFWVNFCRGVGRADLIDRHSGAPLEFAKGDDALARELAAVFATATADEWERRFVEWDCPGCRVLQLPEVMGLPHFEARRLAEGRTGSWPNVVSPIRWHHVDERAGSGLAPPPAMGGDGDAVLRDWLS